MEKAEIKERIRLCILYKHSLDHADNVPVEMKREKLDELDREIMFLENILEEQKFKMFLHEYILGMIILMIGFFGLLFCFLYYGN